MAVQKVMTVLRVNTVQRLMTIQRLIAQLFGAVNVLELVTRSGLILVKMRLLMATRLRS
jgi:hypothetical protein